MSDSQADSAGVMNEETKWSSGHEETIRKTSKDGIILIPQPSADPRDPLVRVLQRVTWHPRELILLLELAYLQKGDSSRNTVSRPVRRVLGTILRATEHPTTGGPLWEDPRSDYLFCKICFSLFTRFGGLTAIFAIVEFGCLSRIGNRGLPLVASFQ